MSIQFDNNASGTLSVEAAGAAPGPEDTTLALQTNEGQLFPPVTTASGNFFFATLEDTSGNIEIVRCTNNVSDVLTVTRGEENTTSLTFIVGSKVEQRTTAATFDEFIQRTGGVMTGTLDMNGQVIQDPVLTSTGSGKINGLPLRGADDGTANEIVVPSGGGAPTLGVESILHTGSGYVAEARTITGGEGINTANMGDLSANRTVDLDVTGLTAISGTDVAGDDEFLVYDTDAAEHKKVAYQSAGVPIILDTGVNPVPTSAQVNSFWHCTNAATVFFDIDTGVGEKGNAIIIQQGGAGVIDFTGGSATVNSAFVNDQTNQLNSVVVLFCTADDVWTLYGDGT